MIRIEEILRGIEVVSQTGDSTTSVSGIEFDSRNVIAGSLFVAVKGFKTDGHDYINAAVRSGAVAVICETVPENPDKKTC